MTAFGYRIPAVFSLLVWCVLWEIIGQMEAVFIFPPFSGVILALIKLVQQPENGGKAKPPTKSAESPNSSIRSRISGAP